MAFPTPIPASLTKHRENDRLFHVKNGRWEERPGVTPHFAEAGNVSGFSAKFEEAHVRPRGHIISNIFFQPAADVHPVINFLTDHWLGTTAEWVDGVGSLWSGNSMWRSARWADQGPVNQGYPMGWKSGAGWKAKAEKFASIKVYMVDLDGHSFVVKWEFLCMNVNNSPCMTQGIVTVKAPLIDIRWMAVNFIGGNVHHAVVHSEIG